MKVFAPVLIFFLVFLPVFGQESIGPEGRLVPCGGGTDDPCDFDKLITLAANVMNFLIFYVATSLSALAIMIGGAMYVMYPANESKRSEAKKIIGTAVTGLVIVLGAWLIVNTLLDALELTSEVRRPAAPAAGGG